MSLRFFLAGGFPWNPYREKCSVPAAGSGGGQVTMMYL
jgi:hypothetical protein